MTLNNTYSLQDIVVGVRFANGAYMRNMQHDTLEEARAYAPGREITTGKSKKYQTQLCFRDEREMGAFYAEREAVSLEMGCVREIEHFPLRFDLDIDFCSSCTCDAKACCDVCWEAVALPAMKRLKHVLETQMEYKGLLFVFSGRRGFHAWVLDRRVWSLDREQRRAILAQMRCNLDEDVTLNATHLCKLPLSVHAATKKRSILIDENFRPGSYKEREGMAAELQKAINESF